MIHKIIDNGVPEYVSGCLLDMIFKSHKWRISRQSQSHFNFKDYVVNPNINIETPQPTLHVFDADHIFDEQLFGYCKGIFDYICYENGIATKGLIRILINANYRDLNSLESHFDIDDDNYHSIVVMLTPNMTQTGLVVGDLFIPYKFCRMVWFDSKDLHSATPLLEDHPLPRISLNFMFEV